MKAMIYLTLFVLLAMPCTSAFAGLCQLKTTVALSKFRAKDLTNEAYINAVDFRNCIKAATEGYLANEELLKKKTINSVTVSATFKDVKGKSAHNIKVSNKAKIKFGQALCTLNITVKRYSFFNERVMRPIDADYADECIVESFTQYIDLLSYDPESIQGMLIQTAQISAKSRKKYYIEVESRGIYEELEAIRKSF